MADYIYLMQNRLTPAQWRALEAIREAARTHNMPVFLVGGAVRDLTSGSPVRDLDFAVQGDVGALRGELESRGGTIAGENGVLSSLYLTFRGGLRTEVGPTLTVNYPQPGKPETQPAAILDDLRRRDFTANAMAISLNEGSYGLLLDPLNGTADIENREFRLVSPYGFIEQPALLLRAARLTERLGWSLEERTQSRYENSKQEGHVTALPAADRGYELEEIFHEEDPLAALAHLEAEGLRDVLFPSLRLTEGDRGSLDEVRELIGQMEAQGLHPDPSAVLFPIITAKVSPESRAALKGLFPRVGFVGQIETMESRSKELAALLTAKSAALPSDAWRILVAADPEVVLYLALHSRTGAVHNRIKAFLKDWPPMRQKIPYAIMQEMRITPDLPEYEKLLDDLFFALIDGKLDTPEATRAFLEPYSPPAPPQVTVRRRPAKATRSRAKRAVEPPADEPAENPESSDSADAEEGAEDTGPETDQGADQRADQGSDQRADRDGTEPTETGVPVSKVTAKTSSKVDSKTAAASKRTGEDHVPSDKATGTSVPAPHAAIPSSPLSTAKGKVAPEKAVATPAVAPGSAGTKASTGPGKHKDAVKASGKIASETAAMASAESAPKAAPAKSDAAKLAGKVDSKLASKLTSKLAPKTIPSPVAKAAGTAQRPAPPAKVAENKSAAKALPAAKLAAAKPAAAKPAPAKPPAAKPAAAKLAAKTASAKKTVPAKVVAPVTAKNTQAVQARNKTATTKIVATKTPPHKTPATKIAVKKGAVKPKSVAATHRTGGSSAKPAARKPAAAKGRSR